MAPALAVSERIVQQVMVNLAAINRDEDAGYHLKIASVKRNAVGENELVYPLLVVVDSPIQYGTPQDPEQPAVMDLEIQGWIRLAIGERAQELSKLVQDVTRRMLLDHTQNGLAVDTDPVSVVPFVTEIKAQPHHMVQMVFRIQYSTLRADLAQEA